MIFAKETQLAEQRDIFLSHATSNKPLARRLAADIEREGLMVWLDEAEIRPGQSILSAVNAGLESSRFLGALMTPDYFSSASGWTHAEWHSFLFKDPDNRQGRFLPILVASCPHIPILISHLLRFDMRDANYDRELPRLVAALRGEPPPRPGMRRGRVVMPGGSIAPQSVVAEQAPALSEPDLISERLSCNLLPLLQLPETVYHSKVKPDSERQSQPDHESKKALIARIEQAATGNRRARCLPSFRMAGEHIYSFYRLDQRSSPFLPVMESSRAAKFRSDEMMQIEDDRRVLISLLNLEVQRHCRSIGLSGTYEPGRGWRYFFPPADGMRQKTISWTPSRRKATRTVAKPLTPGDSKSEWNTRERTWTCLKWPAACS
jgi:hypothetical protein